MAWRTCGVHGFGPSSSSWSWTAAGLRGGDSVEMIGTSQAVSGKSSQPARLRTGDHAWDHRHARWPDGPALLCSRAGCKSGADVSRHDRRASLVRLCRMSAVLDSCSPPSSVLSCLPAQYRRRDGRATEMSRLARRRPLGVSVDVRRPCVYPPSSRRLGAQSSDKPHPHHRIPLTSYSRPPASALPPSHLVTPRSRSTEPARAAAGTESF